MNILIINPSNLKFDVTTVDTQPLGGTESMVCYLARELKRIGLYPAIARNGEDTWVDEIRHISLKELVDPSTTIWAHAEVCITVNSAVIARYIKEKHPNIRSMLWVHMMPQQQAMVKTGPCLPYIDDVIYLSESHKARMEKYFGQAKRSWVIGNALPRSFAGALGSGKKMCGIYTSTPYRGLAYLTEVANAIRRDDPDFAFDVFSSMGVYQNCEEDAVYKEVHDAVGQQPNMKQHGSVGRDALRLALENAAFFTYPCIFRETYSLALLEAAACGCKIVTTDVAEVPHEIKEFCDVIPVDFIDSKNFVRGFTDQLKWNITQLRQKPHTWYINQAAQIGTVNEKCGWDARIKEWERCLRV